MLPMNYRKFVLRHKKSSLQLVTLSAVLYSVMAFLSQLPIQLQAQSHPISQATKNFLKGASGPVGFNPPPGEPQGTASGGSRGSCPQDTDNLTPLTPGTKQGLTKNKGEKVTDYPTLTISEHPTFFVYVPQTAAQEAELIVNEQTGENKYSDFYYTKINLPGRSGIVSIKLPAEKSLKTGKLYQWYFRLICNSNNSAGESSGQKASDSSGNPEVLGWVKRIEADPNLVKALEQQKTPLQRAALYGEYGIWHELLTTLAEQRHSQPGVAAMWENLLKSDSVKLGEISKAPLLECCTLKVE
jgi:hypothetical protein